MILLDYKELVAHSREPFTGRLPDGDAALVKRFLRRASRIIDAAWDTAVGTEFIEEAHLRTQLPSMMRPIVAQMFDTLRRHRKSAAAAPAL